MGFVVFCIAFALALVGLGHLGVVAERDIERQAQYRHQQHLELISSRIKERQRAREERDQKARLWNMVHRIKEEKARKAQIS